MDIRRVAAVPAVLASILATLAGLGSDVPLAAQAPADSSIAQGAPRPRAYVGGAAMLGRPVGELDRYLNAMPGGGIDVVVPLATRFLAIRGEVGLLQYGREHFRVPLSSTIGGRLLADVNTTNMIVFAGAGPQLLAPAGAVRPYLDASVGVAYFATVTSASGDNSRTFASDTNYDDATFAWGAGAGLYIPLRLRRTPVWLDLGARYHGNGRMSYLRKGGIQDLPDGSVAIQPIHSAANLVTVHLGVVVGIVRDPK